ncbi:S41 family peptidase [Gemmatimonas sp.]|uniref:S41 family peptidase n=1 Tax=Gemmatimonas sp. TaxID=1962908 RepID=UPI0025C1E99E|nr:S41 family peptidase [Gemmatimonas sp.]MCA2994702.1 hypothetical protein [Gemmatimonas sp.]
MALRLAIGLSVALLSACGDSPVGPEPPRVVRSILDTLTPRGYVAIAVDSMRGRSVNTARVNWTDFRSRYLARAATVPTLRDTYTIITSALRELDPHSSISPPNQLPGSSDAPTDRPDQRVNGRMITPRLGYVWIPGFIGRSQAGRVDTTHTLLRELDANRPCGWIVDLRHNSGGFVFALMASVGPLWNTDNGFAGGLQYSGTYREFWYYRDRGNNGVFGLSNLRDSAELVVPNPFRPTRRGLPVAVLIGSSQVTLPDGRVARSVTASAAEAITLAFRGGPPSRVFGLPSIGVASGRDFFFMPDSARVDITDSYMFARDGFTPGDRPIAPDQEVAGGIARTITGDPADPTVAAAITWLQARNECTGVPAAPQQADGARSVLDRLRAAPPAADDRRRPKGPDLVFRRGGTP